MILNSRKLPNHIERPPEGYCAFIPKGETETLQIYRAINFFVKGDILVPYLSAFSGAEIDEAISKILDGAVLPPGGVYGQLLTKTSGEDYVAEWKTVASGGGGSGGLKMLGVQIVDGSEYGGAEGVNQNASY